MQRTRRLWDAYRFSGFTPEPKVSGIFGDPKALVIKLRRRGKKRFAGPVAVRTGRFTIGKFVECEIFPAGIGMSGWMWRSAAFFAGVAGR
jgi:hypothetical protein